MRRGTRVLGIVLAIAATAGPAAAFTSAKDDLAWVATGSEPAIGFGGRYVAYTTLVPYTGPGAVAGDTTNVVVDRDMDSPVFTPGPSATVERFPSLDDSGRTFAFQRESTTSDTTCLVNGSLISQVIKASPPAVVGPLTETLISRGPGGPADASARTPVVSRDGSRVAFKSSATNLWTGANSCTQQVYIGDGGGATLVSQSTGGALGDASSGGATVSSDGIAISGTGRYVAFVSGATNLVPGDGVGTQDVFLRDTIAGTTTLISHAEGSSAPAGFARQPAISADGRYVAWTGHPPASIPGIIDVVYLRDMTTGVATIVSRAHGAAGAVIGADRPSLSADGRYVSFMTQAAGAVPDPVTLTVPNGVVRDLQTGENVLGTRAAGPAGTPLDSIDGNGSYPHLSGDGRYLVFWTQSTTISPAGVAGEPDIYLRDLLGPPAADTIKPVLSAVSLTKKQFVRPKKCTVVSRSLLRFTSSEKGAVRVQFRRKVGTKIKVVATLNRTAKQGKNTLGLTGCVGTIRLPAATYTLKITVSDAAKNVSGAKILALKIKLV